MRCLVLIAAVLCLSPLAARAARDGNDSSQRPQSRVEQLIAELGSDEYSVRRRAEEQLLRLGPEAFDALKAAEVNPDLEIAERVRYIVLRMRITWTRPDDSPAVRRLLAQFSDLSEANRTLRIGELAELDDHAGLRALCRVARFDQSPLVARRAALAVIELEMTADERSAEQEACLGELGSSERPPAEWIRLYLRELAEPEAAVAEWAAATVSEAALLKAESSETDFAAVYDLLERHLERCHELKLESETADALLAIVDLTDDREAPADREARNDNREQTSSRLESGLAWAVRWIIDHQQWHALSSVEERYEEMIGRSPKLLYYLAAAADKAGRDDRAVTLAERAFNLEEDEHLETNRVTIAKVVAELGRVDWAEREYRRVIADEPLISEPAMEARSDLAMWLHDREDYQGAADMLGELCDELAENPVGRQQLIQEIELNSSSGREVLRNVEARRDFYLACADEAAGDFSSQRRRLESAINKYDKDPDILIAMYRSRGADEDFKQATGTRIRKTAKDMQALVDEYDDIPTFYNQWAWLVSNTEGDQQLAVEYSKKSLELAPDEPSYLDTLGRCYYAVGDYENAVKTQRRAVELAPQYNVMRRQLALFEEALAEQQRDGASKSP
jgi:tetratricopeptide (TPR) repeat protein